MESQHKPFKIGGNGITRYTDNTIIKFGKFKGEKLANVPDWWLKWYYDENKFSQHTDPLLNYIVESGVVNPYGNEETHNPDSYSNRQKG